MGYTKEVAEKSLLFSNNISVEKAFEWIQAHENDSDFLEEEFLAEAPGASDPNKPKLSKEERAQKAYELQKRLRGQSILVNLHIAKREAEDKRIAEEKEIERIRSNCIYLFKFQV